MKEIMKPVIINGKKIQGYYITNTGRVFSAHQAGGKGGGSNINPLSRSEIKPNIDNGYLRVPLTCNDGARRKFSVHSLVINSFKPFGKHLPACIDPIDFENTPKSVQILLSELFIVNHIDHNKTNNHIDNLERVTSRVNAILSVEFYKKDK